MLAQKNLAKNTMPENIPPEIVSFTQQLLDSGLPDNPSEYPLVSLTQDDSAGTEYTVVAQLYLPDTSVASLNMDITTILPQETSAGTIGVRQFYITYTDPVDPTSVTYSLWLFNIIYDINDGPSADGINVELTGWLSVGLQGIPTPRGTVTIVSQT